MPKHKPLYRWSLEDAVRHNERDEWRESYRENCDCARAIERAIEENYHDNIQQKKDDGRFSQENKAWAKQTHIPKDEAPWHYCVESHPGLTDMFVNQTRRAWQALGLFDQSHCTEEQDYEDKLLILNPSALNDEYKSPDYQLFYAQSGFGCDPNSSGRKVFGSFLKDGERGNFYRSDFLGVIDEKYLPEWAREKLNEINEPEEDESSGMIMQ